MTSLSNKSIRIDKGWSWNQESRNSVEYFIVCTTMEGLNPNWHEAGYFPTPYPFCIRFLSKISKLFWRWKLTSIRLSKMIPCQAHCVKKIGGVEDEHFSYLLTSCQLGLSREDITHECSVKAVQQDLHRLEWLWRLCSFKWKSVL